tara:strand:+ start:587 stop:1660 length:1074 start_codon:yes stop_codon:yes gene_type:complete
MKQSIYFCLLILLTSCGGSDTPTEIENNQSIAATKSKYEFQLEDACGFDKTMVNETVYSFDSDMQADNALKRVMRLTGLPANFEIRAASVPNAAAVIKCDRNGNNCNRYILYNQEFMEKVKDETKTNYAELAILAHEIAHHLSGHTISNTGSSYDMELEADKFAGFMLYKMGASLAETKQSFSNLPTQGSSSHPPRSARLAAVTNGWYEAKRNGETQSTFITGNKKESAESRNTTKESQIKRNKNNSNSITTVSGQNRQRWVNWLSNYTSNGKKGLDACGRLACTVDGTNTNTLINKHSWRVQKATKPWKIYGKFKYYYRINFQYKHECNGIIYNKFLYCNKQEQAGTYNTHVMDIN